jgi:hypothetical protein
LLHCNVDFFAKYGIFILSVVPKMQLSNVHIGLPSPESCYECCLVKGMYHYYHYGCDGQNDTVGSLVNYFSNCVRDMLLFAETAAILFPLPLGLGVWVSHLTNYVFLGKQ